MIRLSKNGTVSQVNKNRIDVVATQDTEDVLAIVVGVAQEIRLGVLKLRYQLGSLVTREQLNLDKWSQ